MARANAKQNINTNVEFTDDSDSLGVEEMMDVYASMVLLRTLDERVWMMNRQGKAPIVSSCQGHEAAQIGSVMALRKHAGKHCCFTYYRDWGVVMAEGVSAKEIMIGFLGKEGETFSGARQFAMQGADLDHNIINISNVVGNHVLHAVGWSLAGKIRGEMNVTATYFGDGATSQGDVHEAMNFAAIHNLPVLFMCENNHYAISLPEDNQIAGGSVAARGAAYGMPGIKIDGTDLDEVYRVTRDAIKRAVDGEGPSLIELDVERFMPHTSDDDDTRYRDPAEVEESRKRDPILKLQHFLMQEGVLTEERVESIRKQAQVEVNAATEAAEDAPFPGDEDVLEHVVAAASYSGVEETQ
jgi:2-oxoisovalerate dehydrogenase E1 component alpha subunit